VTPPTVKPAWEDHSPEEQAAIIAFDQIQTEREKVMARAKKIGHCVCNRTKMCPCDILLEKDVCLCAGESLEDATPTEVPTPT
jgi:hypothetical protein